MVNKKINLKYFIDDWNIDMVPMKKTIATPKECDNVLMGNSKVMYQLVLQYVDKMKKEKNEFIIGAYKSKFLPENLKEIRKLTKSIKTAKTSEEKIELIKNIKERIASITVDSKDNIENRIDAKNNGFMYTKEGYEFTYDPNQNFTFTSQKTITREGENKELKIFEPGKQIYGSVRDWEKQIALEKNPIDKEVDKEKEEENSKRERFLESLKVHPKVLRSQYVAKQRQKQRQKNQSVKSNSIEER